MCSRKRRSAVWTPVVGVKAARGLDWLELTAGAQAVRKFLGGKIRGTPLSGRYVIGVTDTALGRALIGLWLDQLRQGATIPLCDVASYYAHGRRWSLGMALHRGKLVDVWLGTSQSAPAKESP